METFIVHVTDAGALHGELTVRVRSGSIGQVVGAAIDQFLQAASQPTVPPLFIDVQPAAVFAERAWMYAENSTARGALTPTGLDS